VLYGHSICVERPRLFVAALNSCAAGSSFCSCPFSASELRHGDIWRPAGTPLEELETLSGLGLTTTSLHNYLILLKARNRGVKLMRSS
jgi:hypothetical protein